MDSKLITAGLAQEDEVVSWLNKSAKEGNIDCLYKLLGKHPNVLENIDRIPFVDTPLHLAALNNQTRFASNIVNLKPSFAKKLNPAGFSPLHLASMNGHVEMVKMLSKENHTLCLVKGREKMIPLHCAVTAGRDVVLPELLSDLLSDLLSACPDSIKMLTDKDETALHLALKNDRIDAFEVFITELQGASYSRADTIPDWLNDLEILNWKDFEGNTVLHLAVIKEQPQALQLLLGIVDAVKDIQSIDFMVSFTPWRKKTEVLDVNMRDTPLGSIISRGEPNSEIEDMLRSATSQNRVPGRSSIINCIKKASTTLRNFLIAIIFQIFFCVFLLHDALRQLSTIEKTQTEERNALLLAAGLIATTTFQAGITPPGGLWQEDGNGHDVGTSILYTTRPFNFYVFVILNFYAFNMALILLYELTKKFRSHKQLRLTLAFMWVVYVIALISVMPQGCFFIVIGVLFFMFITSVTGSRFLSSMGL